MGVLISRAEDPDLYHDASTEAKRILRISKAARFSVDGKVSSSKLARKLGVTTNELLNHMVEHGLLEVQEGKYRLTAEGTRNGGEYRASSKFRPYFLWPENVFEMP